MINPLRTVYDYTYPQNPLTHKRHFHLLPQSVEFWLGERQYMSTIQDEGGIWDHPKYAQLFENMLQNMAPHTKHEYFPWKITLIDCSELNAWAMPGGRIAVYRRLIDAIASEKRDFGLGTLSLEDRFAAIVGHEMVHPAANHTAHQIAFSIYSIFFRIALLIFLPGLNSEAIRFLSDLFLLSRGRSHELEADRYGMHIMADAGYDPKAALWLQHFFIANTKEDGGWLEWIANWLNDHPSSLERLEANKITLAEIRNSSRFIA